MMPATPDIDILERWLEAASCEGYPFDQMEAQMIAGFARNLLQSCSGRKPMSHARVAIQAAVETVSCARPEFR